MKKLLLILICLFVSFEVKSKRWFHWDYNIPMSKCLKYFEKGRIIDSWSSQQNFDSYDQFIKNIIFSYNGKSYELTIRKKNVDNKNLKNLIIFEEMVCMYFDLDKLEIENKEKSK